jgi:hypothetical protein
MGCDIHFVVEKWFDDIDKWVGVYASDARPAEGYDAVSLANRHYALFADLAGVRGDGPDPKGLPEDISDLTAVMLAGDEDMHSHTWWTVDEAMEIYRKHKGWGKPEYYDGSKFSYAVDEGDKARVIFAFDN